MDRLTDMLERYGEVCTQTVAAKILSLHPRTVSRMIDEGRLRGVEHRVDVRSICEYIENPRRANFEAKAEKNKPRTVLSNVDFMAAARSGRWNR